MDTKMVTEIVSFEIDSSVSDEKFIKIVDIVEKDFHMKQPGYIDSELVKDRRNSWVMIMHWKSIQSVKDASKLLMKNKITEDFRQAIIPSSVKMNYLEQKKGWKV